MTLDQLVREYLIEAGENSLHKYPRFLQYGISGLREFHMDSTGTPTISKLTVNSNYTVDLPNDYLAFIKLAICKDDGNLHYLGYNSNMCPPVFDDCGDITQEQPANPSFGIASSYNTAHYRNNESIGRYYGIGGGTNQNGYYKIWEDRGYITLQGFSGGEIYLEYLADLSRNDSGQFQVHPYIVEALKSWIQWKSIQRNPRRGLGDSQLAEANFNSARNRAERRLSSFTVEEWLAAIRSTFSSAPKF